MILKETCMHAATCEKAKGLVSGGIAPIDLVSKVNSYGLASILLAKCLGCNQAFECDTSPRLENGNFDVNVRAVWGTLVTGNGLSHLNELLAVLDSPGLSRKSFLDIEMKINNWWNEYLQADLDRAIGEEKEIAVQTGVFIKVCKFMH
ncbi:hypothetical protein DPMN_012668 [Dreissena polymorpha]|uniref:Mutator-like transposase domain-containing protein n=1 Tax=Dreissena polymorpha TaxID=45954 RepID=A0A9D4S313_DREPO|nr:hypothetical protein DPMN_012668 [Dreissena polymorpha]